MSRIFTFGCSFTQYMWPTWASVLAFDQQKPLYNFALPGLGNVGIMHRMIEADLKYKFTPEDEIYILWSSWSREDRVKNGNWLAEGSVFNRNNEVYYGYFLRKYWDIDNDIVKNATAIIAANKMYGNLIKWQAAGFEFFTNEAFETKSKKSTDYISSIYEPMLPKIEFIECEKQGFRYQKLQDCHPSVNDHIDIVADHIYRNLNLTLRPETVSYFKSCHDKIEEMVIDKNLDTLDKLGPVLTDYLEKHYKEYWDLNRYQILYDHD